MQGYSSGRGQARSKGWVNLLIVVLVVYCAVLVVNQQIQTRALAQQLDEIVSRRDNLEQRMAELVQESELLLTDEYIEKLAREHLGLVKSGEIPYTITEQAQ